CNGIQNLENVLRLDPLALPIVVQWKLAFQLLNPADPFGKGFIEVAAGSQQLLKSVLRGSDVCPCDTLDSTDFRRVNINVRNIDGIWRKGVGISCDTIVESGPERDQEVAIVDRVVGVRRAMHAQHMQR